ncbi:MAG TPA: rhodanese-like domain-containing protein [Erysipelotrichaceae bacterium]|nr:rhodanese-like domain-containing protein [Erysipelotrichaceae bacterium]
MGLFNAFKRKGIDQWVEEYRKTPGAVLLDVRSIEEYQEGHIPESKNIPVHQIEKVASAVSDKNTMLYVYCHSGARSGTATSSLKRMGYINSVNIGGIISYSGKVVR